METQTAGARAKPPRRLPPPVRPTPWLWPPRAPHIVGDDPTVADGHHDAPVLHDRPSPADTQWYGRCTDGPDSKSPLIPAFPPHPRPGAGLGGHPALRRRLARRPRYPPRRPQLARHPPPVGHRSARAHAVFRPRPRPPTPRSYRPRPPTDAVDPRSKGTPSSDCHASLAGAASALRTHRRGSSVDIADALRLAFRRTTVTHPPLPPHPDDACPTCYNSPNSPSCARPCAHTNVETRR